MSKTLAVESVPCKTPCRTPDFKNYNLLYESSQKTQSKSNESYRMIFGSNGPRRKNMLISHLVKSVEDLINVYS